MVCQIRDYIYAISIQNADKTAERIAAFYSNIDINYHYI